MDWKSLTVEEKLKLTVYHAVGKTCEDIGQDNTLFGPFTVGAKAKELMTEFVWNKIRVHGEDLESFAQHAKRSIINCDDVKLVFRRNEKILEVFSEMDKEEDEKPGKRKRDQSEDQE